jgi:hypothetical protein
MDSLYPWQSLSKVNFLPDACTIVLCSDSLPASDIAVVQLVSGMRDGTVLEKSFKERNSHYSSAGNGGSPCGISRSHVVSDPCCST